MAFSYCFFRVCRIGSNVLVLVSDFNIRGFSFFLVHLAPALSIVDLFKELPFVFVFFIFLYCLSVFCFVYFCSNRFLLLVALGLAYSFPNSLNC